MLTPKGIRDAIVLMFFNVTTGSNSSSATTIHAPLVRLSSITSFYLRAMTWENSNRTHPSSNLSHPRRRAHQCNSRSVQAGTLLFWQA